MSTENTQGFGYVDDNSEDLKSKSVARGEFGLNQGNIIKFVFNPNGGAGNTPGACIDVTFKVKEQEYRQRIFPVTKIFNKEGQTMDPTDPAYPAKFKAEMNQLQGYVTHIVKALGVADETIKTALAGNPQTFEHYAQIMTTLPQAGFEARPLDGFLEYQYKIGKGNTITFLQLPKNMKGGRFLCPAVAHTEPWEARINEEGGLNYFSGNVEHPFNRDANFMKGNKANQQKVGEEGDAKMNASTPTPVANNAGWGEAQ